MNLPTNEWVALADYDPYTDMYEVRVYFNNPGERMALTKGEPLTANKVAEGVEIPVFMQVSGAAWTELNMGNLFKNVYVRKTYWERAE